MPSHRNYKKKLITSFLLLFILSGLFSYAFPSDIKAETTPWTTTSNVLPAAVSDAASTSYQNGTTGFVYSIGGQLSGGTVTNNVYYASTTNGDITSWNTSSHTIPTGVHGAVAGVYTAGSTPYIYVIAGRDSGNTGQSTVFYATINTSTGDVGAWSTSSNSLPKGLLSPSLAIYQSATTPYIYITGGQNNSFGFETKTYYATINTSTGDVGAWSTSLNNLPSSVNKAGEAVFYNTGTNVYLYVVGGNNGSTNAFSTVYYTSINTATGDINAWSTATAAIPTAVYSPATYVDSASGSPYLYIAGGKDINNTVQSSVYFGQINTGTGDIASFTTSVNSLPQAVFDPGGAIYTSGTHTYLYTLGGQDKNSTTLKLVYYVETTAYLSGDIQIDYNTPLLRSLDVNAFSMDETAYNNGNYLTNDTLERTRINHLNLNLMRISLQYHTVHDSTSQIECEASGCDHSYTGDQWVNAIKAVGAQPLIRVPLDSTDAANLVKHFNVDTNNYVKYWVVYNEPDLHSVTAATYSSDFNTIVSAMKAQDPNILVGGPAISFYDSTFMSTFLSTSGSNADFLDFHGYAEGATPLAEATLLSSKIDYGTNIETLRELILTTVPSKVNIPIHVGEWYLNSAAGDTNIYKQFNTVWSAAVIGNIIQAGGQAHMYGTKDNALFSQTNSTYNAVNDDPMPAYMAYFLFTGGSQFPHFGTKLVSANTTLSNVVVYASDNPKNIVVINKDPSTSYNNKTFTLNGMPSDALVEVWGKDTSMNAFALPTKIATFNTNGGKFTYSLSPYSVYTFVITFPTSFQPNDFTYGTNFPPGFLYPIDAGPHFFGTPGFINSSYGYSASSYINKNAMPTDAHITINPIQPVDLQKAKVPLPWNQGFNTVGQVFNYQAVSSLNGYPITSFTAPVTIIIPYDPTLLKGKSSQSLQILAYDSSAGKWTSLSNNLVLNSLNNTIATTVTSFTYFAVGYPTSPVVTNQIASAVNPSPTPQPSELPTPQASPLPTFLPAYVPPTTLTPSPNPQQTQPAIIDSILNFFRNLFK